MADEDLSLVAVVKSLQLTGLAFPRAVEKWLQPCLKLREQWSFPSQRPIRARVPQEEGSGSAAERTGTRSLMLFKGRT